MASFLQSAGFAAGESGCFLRQARPAGSTNTLCLSPLLPPTPLAQTSTSEPPEFSGLSGHSLQGTSPTPTSSWSLLLQIPKLLQGQISQFCLIRKAFRCLWKAYWLACCQGHPAIKWLSQDLNSSLSEPQVQTPLSSKCCFPPPIFLLIICLFGIATTRRPL